MRHHLQGAHARYVRPLAPQNRKAYELWDLGLLVLGLALFWYVTTDPSESTKAALSATLSQLLNPHAWGWVLVVGGVVATGLSYGGRRSVRVGFIVLVAVCTAWCVSLLIGLLFTWPEWQMAGKALGTAYLFGGFASRAFRDGIAADPDDHTMTDNSKAADVSTTA